MQRARSRRRLVRLCLALGLIAVGPGAGSAGSLTRAQVEAQLPALEALAQRAVDAGAVPGLAVAVVLGDETLLLKGYGLRQAGKP